MKRHRVLTTKTLRGFTLPEVVMTAMLLGLISLIATPIFLHATRFYLLNRTRVELQRHARESLSIITRNLRQAQSATIQISQDAGQPYYSKINFTKVGGNTHEYKQVNNRLMETVNGTSRELVDDTRFLNFFFPRSDDLTIVSVAITLEKAIYEGKTKALHVASEKVRVMD